MKALKELTGVAAPLPMINIDTDMIIPKQYLKTISRDGLGKGLFHSMRYNDDGTDNPDFVLNKEAYKGANFLGMLLIKLPQDVIDDLTEQAEYGSNAVFSVDLESQTVTAPDGSEHNFELDEFRKHCLLNGLDEIALTLEKETNIASFEKNTSDSHSWLTPAS